MAGLRYPIIGIFFHRSCNRSCSHVNCFPVKSSTTATAASSNEHELTGATTCACLRTSEFRGREGVRYLAICSVTPTARCTSACPGLATQAAPQLSNKSLKQYHESPGRDPSSFSNFNLLDHHHHPRHGGTAGGGGPRLPAARSHFSRRRRSNNQTTYFMFETIT